MNLRNARDTAHMMIRSYGLQAHAIAQEHVDELLRRGEAGDLERWRAIDAAIGELRGGSMRGGRRDNVA